VVTRTTTSMLLAAIAAAAAAVAFVWSAAAAPADRAAPVRNTDSRTAAPASGTQTYSIFAGSRTRLNATAAGWAPPADSSIRARLGEARLIAHDKTRTVVAVPAAKAPCLISRFADGSQSTACGMAPDEQPVSASYSEAIGLVPDAVDSVTFIMTDGTTRTAAVNNNVWTAPDEAAKAAYSLAGRVIEVDLMPRSSMPRGATSDPSQAPSSGPGGS
jgi:hypothetical protein